MAIERLKKMTLVHDCSTSMTVPQTIEHIVEYDLVFSEVCEVDGERFLIGGHDEVRATCKNLTVLSFKFGIMLASFDVVGDLGFTRVESSRVSITMYEDLFNANMIHIGEIPECIQKHIELDK